MEVEKEPEYKIENRTSSATRISKIYPAYVVAFSLKETYDDLATAQQMICNKYSPQDSVNSLTPTNSVKSIKNVANELSEKLELVSAATELQITKEDKNDTIIVIEENTGIANRGDIEVTNKEYTKITTDNTKNEICYLDDTETMCEENTKSNIFPLVDSLKIITNEQVERVKQILDYSLCTEYLLEKDNKESNESIYLGNSQTLDGFNNKDEKFITDICYDHEKLKLDESPKTDNCKNIEIEIVHNNPKIIFNAKHHKRKENKFAKRKMKKHKTVSKIHFKSNNSRNVINTQIDRYYNENKINIMRPKQIKNEIYADSYTIIISRERVLKNVSAKENLIEEIDLTYIKNISSNASVVSIPSTTKKSCISNASDNTLTRKDSRTLQEQEHVDTVNSVIEIPPEVYNNSDVIIASAAVAYNVNDNTIDNITQHNLQNQAKYMDLACLSSAATLKALDRDSPLTSNSNLLTSSPPVNEIPEETLVNNESSFEISSSYETYYNAKTSSEFKKESNPDYPQIYEAAFHQINEKKQMSLLHRVINLGLYPDTPSTSSAATNDDLQDNVIVADVNKYNYNDKSLDQPVNQDLNNVLKKTNKKPNMIETKTVFFPNQKDIQALFEEKKIVQQKCAEEARNPANTNEILWERIVSVIDLVVKRLEDTLSDKIIGEFKKSLVGFEICKKSSKKIEHNRDVELMSGDIVVYNKEVSTAEVKTESEQGLQCDLIHRNVIDEIVKKLSFDGPQIITTTSKSFPKIKPCTFEEIVEVLKPPLSPMVMEKGETVTISTVTRVSVTQRFNRFKTLLRAPFNFMRENVYILTTVPTFFFALLCLYGLVLLAFRP